MDASLVCKTLNDISSTVPLVGEDYGRVVRETEHVKQLIQLRTGTRTRCREAPTPTSASLRHATSFVGIIFTHSRAAAL